MNSLQKPSPSEFAPFYSGYVAKARSPLLAKLADEAEEWRELLRATPADSEGHRYAPGAYSTESFHPFHESFHLFHGKFPAPDEGVLAGFGVEILKDAG